MSKLTFIFLLVDSHIPVKMSSKFLTFAKGEVHNIFILLFTIP